MHNIGILVHSGLSQYTCTHACMHTCTSTHVLIPFEDGELMGLKVDIARFLTNMLRNVKNHCLLKNCIPLDTAHSASSLPCLVKAKIAGSKTLQK